MKNCIILNYHSIYNSLDNEGYDSIFSIHKKDFVEHLKLIKSSGLKILSLRELHKIDLENGNYVCLTFDDGHPSDFNIVFPLLKEYDLKASFYITMKNVPEDSPRWLEYKKMEQAGFEIGAHGLTHSYLSELTYTNQLIELKESNRIVKEKIGSSVEYFSLPGGKFNGDTVTLANSLGIKGLLTTNFGVNNLEKVPFKLKRCSIKKDFSIDKLKKLLDLDSKLIRRETNISQLKKIGQNIVGSKLSDRINYILQR